MAKTTDRLSPAMFRALDTIIYGRSTDHGDVNVICIRRSTVRALEHRGMITVRRVEQSAVVWIHGGFGRGEGHSEVRRWADWYATATDKGLQAFRAYVDANRA